MLDALLYADDERVSQSDLHEWCGLSRKQVWMHVDRLEEYGVLAAVGNDYVIGEESSVFGGVGALDAAVVGAALSP
jgi:biotin operon repressor